MTVQAAYVEATPAGTSPSSASTSPENLSASTQVTITASPSTNTPDHQLECARGDLLRHSIEQHAAERDRQRGRNLHLHAGCRHRAQSRNADAFRSLHADQHNAYSAATATVQLTVNQATPVITWAPLAAIAQGTALGSAQLDATANVPGAFAYNPAAGNVPAAGTLQLTATFTPTDTTDYASATAHNTLVVGRSNNPTNPTI